MDAYLRRAKLKPVAVYHRGEPKFETRPRGRKRARSGCNIVVSGRDFADFAGQLRDAQRFLIRNGSAIRALRRRPGIDAAVLDFGIERRPEAVVQVDGFPETIVRLAGQLGLALELSMYPPPDVRKPTNKRRLAAHAAEP